MPTITERARLEKLSRVDGDQFEQAAVLLQDVVKSFPISLTAASWIRYRGAVPRRTVLHDISLTVRPGELFGLLGPNGAGKTTLLKMLATLCIADRGQILISGIDAIKQSMAVKQKIGLCTSEERSFYYRLTARENLRFFGALVGLSSSKLEHRVKEMASLVDLTFALDRRFDTFSSGMRQRLALARALLGDPEIIFLDEPTRAIDPLHAREIRALIRDELVTRRGKTAVLATNSLEEAWAICDTVAILLEGRIVAHGPPQTLDMQLTRFRRYRVTLSDTPDSLLNALRKTSGVRSVTPQKTLDGVSLNIELDPNGPVGEVLRILSTSGVAIKIFRSEDPKPLDVFVGLTQHGIDS
jgi:ABC-2 type transport system ATP-binding protein